MSPYTLRRALLGPLLASLNAATAAAQAVPPPDRKAWHEDVTYLDRELRRRHVDLFHRLSEAAYRAGLEALNATIDTGSEPAIAVALARFVSSIGDGHTSFFTDFHPAFREARYPLRFFIFEDGLRVIAAPSRYGDLLAGRVIGIDGVPFEEIYRVLAPLIGADNRVEFLYTVPDFLTNARLLATVGITASPDSARFDYIAAAEGGVRHVWVRAVAPKDLRSFAWGDARDWVDQPVSGSLTYLLATPATVEHARDHYWYTLIPAGRALYLQYNVCWDADDGPSFAAVTQQVFEAVDAGAVDRLIVDLRNNGGGEPRTMKPLLDGIAARPRLRDRRGSVVVLVGRRTFSAALTNAIELRRDAGAVVVGEFSRGKPNNPSEGRDIELPRSKLEVTVSTQFVERDAALGDRPFLPVEVPVPVSFDDYRDGVDPVLATALQLPLDGGGGR